MSATLIENSTESATGAKPIHLSRARRTAILKALADPRRFEVLRQIGRCNEPSQCVAIKDCHQISAATLSHHMKELETAGLVRAARDGKFVSYTLRRDVLKGYMDQLAKI